MSKRWMVIIVATIFLSPSGSLGTFAFQKKTDRRSTKLG